MISSLPTDGAVLLSLDEENIGEVLNVTNHLHERALVIAIEDVRLKGVKMPSTLWEYKVWRRDYKFKHSG